MLSSKHKSGDHFFSFSAYAILERGVCNKNYQNVAALPHALKKAWDEITPIAVWDIFATEQHQINATVVIVESYSGLHMKFKKVDFM